MEFSKQIKIFLILILLSISTGCTTLKSTDDVSKQISGDPLQGVNRAVYGFNKTADKIILKPVAQAYRYVVPKPVNNSVTNFFRNLTEPLNIVNNALQGKGNRALNSTYRLVINSTVGMLGLFEVADYYNIEHAQEDLGQTLASWGVKPGPYIMVPFLGPTNLRDGFGRVVQTIAYYPPGGITNSDSVEIGINALNAIDTRESLLRFDPILESQVDQYSFIKGAYESNRINKIYDDKAPKKEESFDF